MTRSLRPRRGAFGPMAGLVASLGALAAALPAAGARAEEGGAIRGGEHDGFTRIVLEVEPTTEWSLESGSGRAVLHFPGKTIPFSTAGVFDKIPRSRVTAVEVESDRDGSTVEVALACDCRISTSFVGARFLALDVADRTAPRRPDTAAMTARPEADTPAAPADASARARAMRDARTVADAESALIRQIARAADQGIVRFSEGSTPPRPSEPATVVAEVAADSHAGSAARPLPRPADERLTRTSLSRPATGAPETIADLMKHGQISASTVFDRETRQEQRRPRAKPIPGACLADRALDVTAWADGEDFAQQLAHLRGRLVGEFDQPNPDVILATARLYIHFGLGAEAEATLAAFPDARIPERPVLVDLARVVDGQPVADNGPLAIDADCPGLHAVWLAAGGVAPVWRSAASFEEMHAAFTEMPVDLRALLAPTLVRRLIADGRIPQARVIYLTAVRPGEMPGPALQLAGARLEAAEGRSAEAVRTMAKLARSGEASISIDALADLIRVALDSHLPIPEAVATDLATATLQNRGSDRDQRLRGLLAETLAQRGDLTGALAELRRAMADLPRDAGRFAALSVRLVAEADPAMIGNAVYAEAALGAQDLIESAPPADPDRAMIAGRLVELGLPDPALAIVAPGLAAGDEAARMVAARAQIARGDGPAAREALGALASTAAVELRAQAYARAGDYDEALATLDAAGLGQSAAEYAWASGDWRKAGEVSTDADRTAMARYMAARAGEEPAPQPAPDPAALTPDAAFQAPVPSLDRPSLGAARRLLATGQQIGDFVEGAISEP